MKIAIVASLFAEGDVEVNAAHDLCSGKCIEMLSMSKITSPNSIAQHKPEYQKQIGRASCRERV